MKKLEDIFLNVMFIGFFVTGGFFVVYKVNEAQGPGAALVVGTVVGTVLLWWLMEAFAKKNDIGLVLVSFEYFLQKEHMKQNPSVLDDDLPSHFSDWLSEIEYAELYQIALKFVYRNGEHCPYSARQITDQYWVKNFGTLK